MHFHNRGKAHKCSTCWDWTERRRAQGSDYFALLYSAPLKLYRYQPLTLTLAMLQPRVSDYQTAINPFHIMPQTKKELPNPSYRNFQSHNSSISINKKSRKGIPYQIESFASWSLGRLFVNCPFRFVQAFQAFWSEMKCRCATEKRDFLDFGEPEEKS